MSKMYNIVNLFYDDGTNNKMVFARWIAIYFIFIIINGMPTGESGVSVPFIGTILPVALMFNYRNFYDKRSLSLNLALSDKKQVLFSYLSTILTIVMAYICMIITLIAIMALFTHLGTSIEAIQSVNESFRGSIYMWIMGFTAFLLYFPLCFIRKNKIWWSWAAAVSIIITSINLVVINNIPKYANDMFTLNFKGDVVNLFDTLPNANYIFAFLIAFLILSIFVSYKSSCYFNSYKRHEKKISLR